jgi:hypothetical protein
LCIIGVFFAGDNYKVINYDGKVDKIANFMETTTESLEQFMTDIIDSNGNGGDNTVIDSNGNDMSAFGGGGDDTIIPVGSDGDYDGDIFGLD